jgi:hypothetical protein
VVIGENMTWRTDVYARREGAETITDWLGGRKWTPELNDEFIKEMMAQGRRSSTSVRTSSGGSNTR